MMLYAVVGFLVLSIPIRTFAEQQCQAAMKSSSGATRSETSEHPKPAMLFPNEITIEGFPLYHHSPWSTLIPMHSTMSDVISLFGKAAPEYRYDNYYYVYKITDRITLEVMYVGEVSFIRRGDYPKLKEHSGYIKSEFYFKLYSLTFSFYPPLKLPNTFHPSPAFKIGESISQNAKRLNSRYFLNDEYGLRYFLTKYWRNLSAKDFWERDHYPPTDIELNSVAYTLSDTTRCQYGIPLEK